MKREACAYCGSFESLTREHAIPKCLYPKSKEGSPVQRIIVPGCKTCNSSWSKDEEHFKAVMAVSGESNSAVQELWPSILRGFNDEKFGMPRKKNLAELLVVVQTENGQRHRIYPGKDPRVIRVIKKIVRGLCHHHNLLTCLSDDQIFADVEMKPIPSEFDGMMINLHAEEDILRYRYGLVSGWRCFHSIWSLTFFERTSFIVIVFSSPAAMVDAQNGNAEFNPDE